MEKRLYSRGKDTTPIIHEGGRQSRLMVAPKFMDVDGFAMGYQIIPPGIASKAHVHENEQEAFFVVKGKGKAVLGDKSFEIGPETAWAASAGVPHCIQNTGEEDLMFVWTFCPPLPGHIRDK